MANYPLSDNTISKIRNEIEVFGGPETINTILSFRSLNRKDPQKTLKIALSNIHLFPEHKFQPEIHALLTDWADNKKSVLDPNRTKISSASAISLDIINKKLEYNGKNLRIEISGDDISFSAKELCYCLDLSQVAQACSKLDEEDGEIFIGANGEKMVSEAGMYQLVFRSNKYAARKFRKWVSHDVLPEIRKTGGYISPNANINQIQALEQKLSEKHIELKSANKTISLLEGNQRNTSDRVFPEIVRSVNKKRLSTNPKYREHNIDKELKYIQSNLEIMAIWDQISRDPSLASDVINIIRIGLVDV